MRDSGYKNDPMQRLSVGSIVLLAFLHFSSGTLAAQSCVYVVNLGSDTVSVIDVFTNTVTKTILVGRNPNGIVTSAYGGFTCVTNFGSNDVSLIDPNTQTVAGRVAVGAGPVGIARPPGLDTADPDIPESLAYVTNKQGGSVSVIEVGTARVIATIPVDPIPENVAVWGSWAYVTHAASLGSVSVIDRGTNTVTAKIPVGARPGRMAFARDGRLYIANFGSFNISVIDTGTNTVTGTIGLSLRPSGISVTPDGRFAYVTNFGAPIVSIIPTRTDVVHALIAVGDQPAAVAHVPNRVRAYTYVANSGSDTVSVINRASRNQIMATIAVGHRPFAVAVGGGNCAASAAAPPTAAPSGARTSGVDPTANGVPTATLAPSSAAAHPTTATTGTTSATGGCAIGDLTAASSALLCLLPAGLWWLRRRR